MSRLTSGEDGQQILEIGDRVVDRDQPRERRSPARVVDIPGETAEEFVIEGIGETVADLNAGYPADAQVVGIRFEQRGEPAGQTYHYPAARLERVDDEWEPQSAKSDAQRKREATIERHEKQFEAFKCAVERLAEDRAAAARFLGKEYDPAIRPDTRGGCVNAREDDYRPAVEGALVCWRCNDGGRRPRKLMANDEVPADAPCRTDGTRDPSYALKIWFWEEVVPGNESPGHMEAVAKSIAPNSEFTGLGREISNLTGVRESWQRSAVLRIAYEATVGGVLDEDYNHSRTCAYLRDLGVDTDAVLPGGDPYLPAGGDQDGAAGGDRR